MCTLVILRRPEHPWPLLVAGNRDEMRNRRARPPGRHWEDRPDVIAGLDELGGGSWFGVNPHGVVAAVMNRARALGPEVGKRTRGELVLEALDHAEAGEAARALADLDANAYRAFNLFVGDPLSAFWLRHRGNEGAGRVELFEVPPGLHMLTVGELDDVHTTRIRLYLPRMRAAPIPDPDTGDWGAWKELLAERTHSSSGGPHAAMNLDLPNGFGTVCSQLVAVPRYPSRARPPVFLFAAGPPDQAPYAPVRFE